MGIASGVFWIVFGICYVIYQGFKEHPRETFSITVLFVLLGAALASWVLIFNALLDYDLTVATVFTAISVVVLLSCFAVTFKKQSDEREETRSIYQRALEIARNEQIDEEELKRFENANWARAYGLGKYQSEKYNYKFAIDKSRFRDLIVKDYIENYRVYQIMANLKKQCSGQHTH